MWFSNYVSFCKRILLHTFAEKFKDMRRDYSFNSVEVIPDLQASAAFTAKSSEVFKEQSDMNPMKIAEGYEYIPWGMPGLKTFRFLCVGHHPEWWRLPYCSYSQKGGLLLSFCSCRERRKYPVYPLWQLAKVHLLKRGCGEDWTPRCAFPRKPSWRIQRL